MIPLALAQRLSEAGLIWVAGRHDFFGIPDRGMDEKVFVLTDIMANLEILQGWPVVAFHGAAEWALDYIYTADVVWLPTESQLRSVLEDRLSAESDSSLSLTLLDGSYECRIRVSTESLSFQAPSAEEAYGQALLYVLRLQNRADRV